MSMPRAWSQDIYEVTESSRFTEIIHIHELEITACALWTSLLISWSGQKLSLARLELYFVVGVALMGSIDEDWVILIGLL